MIANRSTQTLVRHIAWMIFLATAQLLAVAKAQIPVTSSPFDQNATSSDAKFGAQLGASSQWQSQFGSPGGSYGQISFGGGLRLGCSGVDFNGFLRSFDPKEVIAEIRNSLLNGAQAAASTYLLTLAYSDPTISSVLDMMDKRYSARFSAFAQACDAQAARAQGQSRGARAMAEAGDQCFGQEVARGTAPTEAYRRCSIMHTFDSLNIPATAGTADFLRRYTSINVTREMEALLTLLPDHRVQGGAFQMHPPTVTVAGFSDRIRARTRIALDSLDSGVAATDIATCKVDDILANITTGLGCLPTNAVGIVTSNAFRSSRLLGSTSRAIFKDALSSQIAIVTLYSALLDLYQQAAKIDVRAGTGADAAHAASRRQQMQESIAQLLQEADAQVKEQASKMQLVRMQMLALEQVESDMDANARRDQEKIRVPQFGMRDLLSLFSRQN